MLTVVVPQMLIEYLNECNVTNSKFTLNHDFILTDIISYEFIIKLP